MTSQTEENYLKAAYFLANSNNEINLSELSKSLNVSKPTANSMVKKLCEKGFLDYEKYKPLVLTSKGKKQAALIIRKHRLTEMFLVKKMNFGWEEVHDIAEQIEHIKSSEFFDRMDELLNYPTHDPHGSPIPNKNGEIIESNFLKMSLCKPGQKVKLSGLLNSSKEFLLYLNDRNLQIGSVLNIHAIENFDRTMIVSYNDQDNVNLSAMVCERLLVTVY
ncbi:MAG: metal-dependent transcriptional regulator [Flavobacteriales bacterium]